MTTKPTPAQIDAVTDDMIKAGCEAIDAYYDGTKDAPFSGSVKACYLAMRLVATIERCAQVAEKWKHGASTESAGIAAAIRALKDHP